MRDSSFFPCFALWIWCFLSLVGQALTAQPPGNSDHVVNVPQTPLISQPDLHHHRLPLVEFHLRHVFHHGVDRHPCLARKLDITQPVTSYVDNEDPIWFDFASAGALSVVSNPLRIQRLANRDPLHVESIMAAGRARGSPMQLPSDAWTVDTIPGPNVTDKQTVLSFARMASNAYVTDPNTGEWEDVGCGFNYTDHFGWESDGLRGHIFADEKNQTVVIGLKGTSLALFDGDDSSSKDKINDNLFFSCCCGQGGNILWRQVCDCQTSTYTCNSTCLVKSLREKDRYYAAAQQLYHNVTAIYPHADIWLSGHSLGGAVSALLGLTYGLPAVTFESPGDALPAARLGLPTPPGYRIGSDGHRATTGGFHFGHTADPVYMGTCSSCSLYSYAMESVCHTGMECRYDTVNDLGWRSSIWSHRISVVIPDVIEAYEEPAKCEVVSDCVDCFNWKYFESNGTISTVTSKSRSSVTATSTCKTPGWWGCLDEDPTTTSSTMMITSSSRPVIVTTTSSSSCTSPGWWGCPDDGSSGPSTSKTKFSKSVTVSTTSKSICKTPGWFGCGDESKRSSSTTWVSSSPSVPSTMTSISICKTMGWWSCEDESTTTRKTKTKSESSIPATTTLSSTCENEFWFWCMDRTATVTEMPTTTASTATSTRASGPFLATGRDVPR